MMALPAKIEGPELVKRLRDVVRPSGKKATWMQHLTDKQLVEVYHRLRQGQSDYKVARIVQTDWGMMRESEQKSLCRAIRAFRNEVLGELDIPEKSSQAVKDAAAHGHKKAKFIGGKINAYGTMCWLMQTQLERVNMLYEREKVSLPFKHTGADMRLAMEMVAEVFKMQKDLGIIDQVPQELNIQATHLFGGIMQHVVGDGANKMVSTLERFVNLIEENSQTLRMDPVTGTYQLEDKTEAKEEPAPKEEKDEPEGD
jgi:hypothetical protein